MTWWIISGISILLLLFLFGRNPVANIADWLVERKRLTLPPAGSESEPPGMPPTQESGGSRAGESSTGTGDRWAG